MSLGSAGRISGYRYTDFTDDNSTSTLAVVTCETRHLQQQNVSWLRNGEILSLDGHDYEMTHELIDRTDSHYGNNLVIRDVFGLLNSPVYTCRIASGDLLLSRNVTVNIDLSGEYYTVIPFSHLIIRFPAVQVEAEVVPSSTEARLGRNFTLTCQTRTVQSKPTLTNPLLQTYLRRLRVEWFDINGNPISEEDSITFGELSSNFSHSIDFTPLSRGQDRLYVCAVTFDVPETHLNSSAKYAYEVVFGESRRHILYPFISSADTCTLFLSDSHSLPPTLSVSSRPSPHILLSYILVQILLLSN